jgi:selenide,water dikinase
MGEAVHAVTDVTGYGLAGHGWEMAERSGSRLVFDAARLPLYDGALAAAEAGTRTGGDARNREHLADHVVSSVAPAVEALCFDPQTSGGLLAALEPSAASSAEAAGFTLIGEVVAGPAGVSLRA